MARYLERLRILAPHYAVMLLLTIIVIGLLAVFEIDIGRPERFVLIIAILIGYVIFLRLIGRAPEPWA